MGCKPGIKDDYVDSEEKAVALNWVPLRIRSDYCEDATNTLLAALESKHSESAPRIPAEWLSQASDMAAA